MITLVFDTETTGIPGWTDSWEIDYAKFPFIASIAWQVHDDNKLLYEQYNYIRPDGWEMGKEAGAVNGLTTDFLLEKGLDAKSVFRHIITDMSMCDRIIGHNISFDTKMLKSNLLKLGVSKEHFNKHMDKEKRYCTMINGFKRVSGPSGKWPNLTLLHNHLFGEDFNAHDALADVKATHRCYLELIK
jgi:DNA polymerase III epsilon subunit-like protein